MSDSLENTPAPSATPAPVPPAAPAPDPAPAGGPAKVEMTQEAFNALIAERVERAKRSAVGDVLKDLQLEDIDTLKGVVKEHQAQKKAQQTVLEQMQADLEAAKKTAASLTEAQTQAQARLEALLVKTAVESAAQEQGFLKEASGDVLLLIRENKELSELLKTDIEGLTVAGADAAVKKVAELRPHWLAKTVRATVPPGKGSTPTLTTPKPANAAQTTPLVSL